LRGEVEVQLEDVFGTEERPVLDLVLLFVGASCDRDFLASETEDGSVLEDRVDDGELGTVGEVDCLDDLGDRVSRDVHNSSGEPELGRESGQVLELNDLALRSELDDVFVMDRE